MDFHQDQAAVWGEGHEAWAQAMAHIQEVDRAMIRKVTEAVEAGATPEAVYTLCLEGYLDPSNPRHDRVLARMETNRALVLERLTHAMDFGTPPHLIPHIVVNPMLRGRTVLED